MEAKLQEQGHRGEQRRASAEKVSVRCIPVQIFVALDGRLGMINNKQCDWYGRYAKTEARKAR